jgi:hypothetical protein
VSPFNLPEPITCFARDETNKSYMIKTTLSTQSFIDNATA